MTESCCIRFLFPVNNYSYSYSAEYCSELFGIRLNIETPIFGTALLPLLSMGGPKAHATNPRCYSEKSNNHHISATVCPLGTKFHTVMQNLLKMTPSEKFELLKTKMVDGRHIHCWKIAISR